MEFFYRAITGQGERVSGTHYARNTAAARRELALRYDSVLELTELDSKELAKRNKPFRVKQEVVAIFFRRMATMLNAGVSLTDALHFMVTSEADDDLAKAVEYLTGKVAGGNTLSRSMGDSRLRLIFDTVSIGMIALGEQTGQLARVMHKLANLKERQLSLTRSLVSTLTYPAVLFCAIMALGLVFTLILGPGENGIFSAFGNDLPWPTRAVQSVASVVRQPWILLMIVGVVVSFVAAFRYRLRHHTPFRLRVHLVLIGLPVIGPLLSKIECAKILYVLSDGLEVGIPAIQVMTMAREVCGNEKIKVELSCVLRDFAEGSELPESLRRYDVFPPMVLSMVEVGMESGQLDKILAQASLGYEEEVQMALDNVAQLAEPMLLMFAGILAGFLAIATLLPIMKMVESL